MRSKHSPPYCRRQEWMELYFHFPYAPSWQGQEHLVFYILLPRRWRRSVHVTPCPLRYNGQNRGSSWQPSVAPFHTVATADCAALSAPISVGNLHTTSAFTVHTVLKIHFGQLKHVCITSPLFQRRNISLLLFGSGRSGVAQTVTRWPVTAEARVWPQVF